MKVVKYKIRFINHLINYKYKWNKKHECYFINHKENEFIF